MGRPFLWEIIPQLQALLQLDEAGWAHGPGDFAVNQPELGRSSAEGTSAAVFSLWAPVRTRHKLSRLSAGARAGPRGLGAAAVVPSLTPITSESPPTRSRGADREMPWLIDLCCLPQQPVCPEGETRSPTAQRESVPERSAYAPGTRSRGGRGAASAMRLGRSHPRQAHSVEDSSPFLHRGVPVWTTCPTALHHG